MAKKGEPYARVQVDLAKWAADFLRINNLNHSQLANRIHDETGKPVNRARITDMLAGRLNTMEALQRVGRSIYNRNYMALEQYAMDDKGVKTLAILNMMENLEKSEQKVVDDHYQALMQAIAQKDLATIKECTKLLKK